MPALPAEGHQQLVPGRCFIEAVAHGFDVTVPRQDPGQIVPF
jgi:hypothetical protein